MGPFLVLLVHSGVASCLLRGDQPAINVHARKERPRMPWRAQTHKPTGEEVSNIVHSIMYAALRLSALLSAKTPRSVGPSVDLRSRHVGHIVAGACPWRSIIICMVVHCRRFDGTTRAAVTLHCHGSARQHRFSPRRGPRLTLDCGRSIAASVCQGRHGTLTGRRLRGDPDPDPKS